MGDDEEFVLLHDYLVDEEVIISREELYKDFDYAFAMTTHRAQGTTISKKFCIYEWDKMYNRMKYTAISRTSKKCNVYIMPSIAIPDWWMKQNKRFVSKN